MTKGLFVSYVFVGVITALVLYFFVFKGEDVPPLGDPATSTVLTIGTSGGLCASGETCRTSHDLMANGQLGNVATVPKPVLAKVQDYLKTIKETSFFDWQSEGDCGSSPADGSDIFVGIAGLGEFEACQNLPGSADKALDGIISELSGYLPKS